MYRKKSYTKFQKLQARRPQTRDYKNRAISPRYRSDVVRGSHGHCAMI